MQQGCKKIICSNIVVDFSNINYCTILILKQYHKQYPIIAIRDQYFNNNNNNNITHTIYFLHPWDAGMLRKYYSLTIIVIITRVHTTVIRKVTFSSIFVKKDFPTNFQYFAKKQNFYENTGNNIKTKKVIRRENKK